MNSELINELKKALIFIKPGWKMQTNFNDFKSKFIYYVKTVDEVIKNAKKIIFRLNMLCIDGIIIIHQVIVNSYLWRWRQLKKKILKIKRWIFILIIFLLILK